MSIFKANDIRGVYGTDLTEKEAYRIGNAAARFFAKPEIIVARDSRLSSPSLAAALMSGIIETGCNVIDCGLMDAPGFYFATAFLKHPGIYVTASHNPVEYNGMYVCSENAFPINEATGLHAIEKLSAETPTRAKKKGRIHEKDLKPQYTQHVLSFAKKSEHTIKAVIDAGNGMGAWIAEAVYSALSNVSVTPLFWSLDGSFPNHGPDPTDEKNLKAVIKAVKKQKADIGIVFDGDADRAVFVDEKGKAIDGSLIGTLLAEHMLQEEKGPIVFSSTCSRILPETIAEHGGIAFKERVGHSFIGVRMRKVKALLGVENTGHYFYRQNSYADSGIITAVMLCNILAAQKKPLSTLVKKYAVYHRTDLNLRVKNQMYTAELIEHELTKQKPLSTEHLDGFEATFADFWLSVRVSQTEPLVRIHLEAASKKALAKAEGIIHKIIKSVQSSSE